MYAISTPIDDQYAGDGIGIRGISYGMHTQRVDGNDIFAVYNAVKKAREIIIKEKRPALVESISYRVGDHSTSDFSQRYRDEKEMKKWQDLMAKLGNPIFRLESYLMKKGWIKEGDSAKWREEVKIDVREALKAADAEKKPPIGDMFTDVYKEVPQNLKEQQAELWTHLKQYHKEYKTDNFKDSEF